MSRNVHVHDREGRVIYDRLVDDGAELVRFGSGFGYLTRSQIKREGWTLCQGWTAGFVCAERRAA